MSDRILICGDEPFLLETRYMVLVRAGFVVVSSCTQEEIASLPDTHAFGLAMIGRMLAEEDKKSIVQELRRRWPGIRILYLTDQLLSLQQLSGDEYQSNSQPPNELVANCRQILEGESRAGPASERE
jgi:DNA-binding response OmpR family regulator